MPGRTVTVAAVQAGACGSGAPELGCEPKVRQLDAPAVVDEQVGEGDVAVRDAAAVQVVQRGGQLLGQGGGQRLRQRAVPPDEFVQVAVPAQLHDQVNAVGVLKRALARRVSACKAGAPGHPRCRPRTLSCTTPSWRTRSSSLISLRTRSSAPRWASWRFCTTLTATGSPLRSPQGVAGKCDARILPQYNMPPQCAGGKRGGAARAPWDGRLRMSSLVHRSEAAPANQAPDSVRLPRSGEKSQ